MMTRSILTYDKKKTGILDRCKAFSNGKMTKQIHTLKADKSDGKASG